MSLIKCDIDEFQSLHEPDLQYFETIRAYECEKCEGRFAEKVKRSEKIRQKCPECKSNTLDSLILGVPHFYTCEITTVGQYWEKVRKRELGRYGYQEEAKRRKDEFEADLKNATAGNEYFDKPGKDSEWLRDKRVK